MPWEQPQKDKKIEKKKEKKSPDETILVMNFLKHVKEKLFQKIENRSSRRGEVVNESD